MGSLVEYRCPTCRYDTGKLSVGWGKAGRASYWGGLALCTACKSLGVVDLSDTRTDRRDRRCAHCNGPLKLIDLIGLDVHLHASEAVYEQTRRPEFAPPPLLRNMVAAGFLGKKTGRGFREWGET